MKCHTKRKIEGGKMKDPENKPTSYFPTCKCGMAVVALLQEAGVASVATDPWTDSTITEIFEPLIKEVEASCSSIDFPQLRETVHKVLKENELDFQGRNSQAFFSPISNQLMENFRECHPNQNTGSVKEELQQSIAEEKEATHNYNRRTENADKEGDYETSALFNHIRREEIRHSKELEDRIKIYKTVKEATPEDARALYKEITGKEID